MKTQVAKLVYDPLTKLKRTAVVNENEKPAADKEFQKKREDLNREVKEIHEMLNEMSKSPANRVQRSIEAEKQDEPKPVATKSIAAKSIERSKTETNLRPPATRRNRFRLDNHTTRSKSANTLNTDDTSPMPRKKTHNSEETRRFMQEQRKKRRSLQTAFGGDKKPAVDRNEIKKRLEDLRKNTLQIVNKNVNKAKKKPVATVKESTTVQRQDIPTEKVDPLEIKLDTDRTSAWSDMSSKRKASSDRCQDPTPLSENFKKIGLLRKPEIKDHSFNAIKDLNMDKENLIIEHLTPLLTDGSSCRSKEAVVEEPKHVEDAVSERKDLPSDGPQWRHQELSRKPDTPISIRKRSSIPELDLKVPDAKLKTRVSVREKSVQVDTPSFGGGTSKPQQKKAELPYWLKPTSVQVYPYNFIMAVRKKLEAIANPPAVASSSPHEHSPKKQSTDVSSLVDHTSSPKRKSTDNIDKSLSKSAEKSASRKEKPYESLLSKSFTEVASNFSSISIQMPTSNTVSSLKSKSEKPKRDVKKPLRFDEDDTTVSSSVFSSPEKKQKINGIPKRTHDVSRDALSPLSMDNVSNMQIKSRMRLQNITLGRGDSFHEQKLESGAISSRSEGSVDFSQLLDDFNRSLSQVIEVNHQLKTTLVKSHQMCSPEKAKRPPMTGAKTGGFGSTKSIELTEYVSDFEESSNGEEGQNKGSNRSQTSSIVSEIHTASQKASESENATLTTASSSNEDAVVEEEDETTTQHSDEEVQTQEQSHTTLEPKTFIVSSDDPAYDSPEEKTIQEDVLDGSPQKENLSTNHFSRDSLELSPREDYIKSHINTSRGDFQFENSEKSVGPPPSYKAPSRSQDIAQPHRIQSNFGDSSLESEFVRVFNKSDLEISVMSSNRSLSESTINYSSIGLYEQLIQSETSKSEHLAALLKMREKAIIDRTKGQIAWLEVQKERYKTKGLTLQISAVKKKQRGILLKMEKEREEIKKLLQQTKVQRDHHKLRIPEIRPISDVTLLHQRRTGVQTSAVSQAASVYHHHQQQQHHQHLQQHQQLPSQQHKQHQTQWSSRSKSSPGIVRGYELETSRSLEQLLQKREEDLRRRREHVERLMEWHRRLDQEEAEVLQLERMLLNCNNAQTHQEVQKEDEKPSHTKMERKLKEIDKSLRELNSIAASSDGGGGGSTDIGGDFVRTSGSKLNKLWRRLTSQRIEKYDPNKRYKLCKSDLEQLYEDAKLAVLQDFGESAGQVEALLAQSSTSTHQSTMSGEVPRLNLNFSSGQSDVDVVRGNYSPCAAQEVFLGFAGTSTSSKEGLSEESNREEEPVSKRRVGRSNSSPSLSSLPEMRSSYGNKLSESLANVTSLPRDSETVSDQELQRAESDGSGGSENKSETDGNSQGSVFSSNNSVGTKTGCVPAAMPSDIKSASSQTSSSDHAAAVTSESVSGEESVGEMCSKNLGTTASSSEKRKSHEVKTASGSYNGSQCNRISASEIASASDLVAKISDSRSEDTSESDSISKTSGRRSVVASVSGLFTNTSDSPSAVSSMSGLIAKTNDTRSSRSEVASVSDFIAKTSDSRSEAASASDLIARDSRSSRSEVASVSGLITKTSDSRSSRSEVAPANDLIAKASDSHSEVPSVSGLITKSSRASSASTANNSGEHRTRSEVSPSSSEKSAESQSGLPQSINEALSSATARSDSKSQVNTLSNARIESSQSVSRESTPVPTTDSNGVSEASLDTKHSSSTVNSGSSRSQESKSTTRANNEQSSSSQNRLYSANTSPIDFESCVQSSLQSTNATGSSNGTKTSERLSAAQKTDTRSASVQQTAQDTQSSETSPEALFTKNEASEETWTELRSIKSLDHSTNSKHSSSNSAAHLVSSNNGDASSTETRPSSNVERDKENGKESTCLDTTYSTAFESSKQTRSTVIMSTNEAASLKEDSNTLASAFYEADFTEAEETNIDDLSLPKFETTADEEPDESQQNLSQSPSPSRRTELESRLIDLDVSLKDLNATFEKALSPEKSFSPPREDASSKCQSQKTKEQTDSALMPDVINEIELRRRQQVMLENEMKQFEHAVPYMYVREIPNKPPPPYVPPAHGSPMTTIFPSEERIKDITYRRTSELYYEMLNIDTTDENGKKPPSLMDENITNIYERIILDICKEYLTEYESVLTSADPGNFHSPLAFFNPPDRLKCMQDFIYKEVRKSLAMDKNAPKRNQVYSVYGHRGKRDHIGEIIIQEMYEEDDRWCNFYAEEAEVLELIIDEMIGGAVRDIAMEVLEAETPNSSPAAAAVAEGTQHQVPSNRST